MTSIATRPPPTPAADSERPLDWNACRKYRHSAPASQPLRSYSTRLRRSYFGRRVSADLTRTDAFRLPAVLIGASEFPICRVSKPGLEVSPILHFCAQSVKCSSFSSWSCRSRAASNRQSVRTSGSDDRRSAGIRSRFASFRIVDEPWDRLTTGQGIAGGWGAVRCRRNHPESSSSHAVRS